MFTVNHLLGGESSSDGSGLLLSQVNWDESLTSVLLSQLRFGDLVCDGQDAGNVLSHFTDSGQLSSSTIGDLSNTKGLEFTLQVLKLVDQLSLALGSQFVSSYFSC